MAKSGIKDRKSETSTKRLGKSMKTSKTEDRGKPWVVRAGETAVAKKHDKSTTVVYAGRGYRIEVILPNSDRPEFSMTAFEKMELVEEGISKKALESLKEKAGLDYDQLAKVLNVARATLISKKGNQKFNKDLSDKILGLADIYSYGYEVFEDQDRFNDWIFRGNKALGGQAPIDILNSSFGREEVKNLIGRIDYGVYS